MASESGTINEKKKKTTICGDILKSFHSSMFYSIFIFEICELYFLPPSFSRCHLVSNHVFTEISVRLNLF